MWDLCKYAVLHTKRKHLHIAVPSLRTNLPGYLKMTTLFL